MQQDNEKLPNCNMLKMNNDGRLWDNQENSRQVLIFLIHKC